MRKRDIELISALVEGRLDDESEARALVESSRAHREEYEAQKLAYDALTSIPNVTLTESEQAVLRRDVWSQLQSQPRATKAKAPWALRWSFAAAGLFVVVGLFLAVDLTQSSSNDSGEVFFEISSSLDDGEDGATRGAETEAAETTSAASTEEDLEGAAALDMAMPPVEVFAELAAQARSGELSSEQTRTKEQRSSCLETAGLGDHQVIGEVLEDELYLLAIPDGEVLGPDTPITFVQADLCLVSYIDE